MLRNWLLVATILLAPFSYGSPIPPQEGVHAYDFRLSALGWSPAMNRLYALSELHADSVLRIDPESGTSQSFPVGPRPAIIVMDSDGGAWVACNGDGTIRRINLETMNVEETIAIPGRGVFTGLTVSPGDPFTLVACREDTLNKPRGYYIRRGVLLSDWVQLVDAVIESGTIFGTFGNQLWRLILGPNGFVAGQPLYHSGPGPMQSHDRRIYHSTGIEGDAVTGHALPGFSLPHWGGVSLAVNAQEDSVYLLSQLQFSSRLTLSRFDRLTREHTGLIEFQSPQGLAGAGLTTWSNRAAFAGSNGKLYVVETDKAFLPADLEVLQVVNPSHPSFGDAPVVSLIITNKGPGPALNFHWKATLDPNFFVTPIPRGFSNVLNFDYYSLLTRPWDTTIYPSGPDNYGGILSPGRYITIASLPLLPLRAGLLTNSLAVETLNDPNPGNNNASFAVPIAAPGSSAPVVRLALGATGLAADPGTGRLFINAAAKLLTINPGEFALSQPIDTGLMQALAFSERNPLALIGYPDNPGTLSLVDTRTFSAGTRKARGRIYDVALSPIPGLNHFAVSDAVGLSEGDFFVPGERFVSTPPGPIEYSADGQRLYHLNINTCSLQIFAITRDGSAGALTLEHTEPNLSCADFSRAGALLFFDDGTVYNAEARQRLGKISGVSTPGYVAPDQSGHVNVLTRTNGLWLVRRYATNDLAQPASVVEIGTLPSGESPLDAVSFGHEQLAFSTSSGLYLVSVRESSSRPQLSARPGSDGHITLRFETSVGARYTLSASPAIHPLVWTNLESETVGTGNPIELTIRATETRQFFRLIRQ